jgi:hypothetical protein
MTNVPHRVLPCLEGLCVVPQHAASLPLATCHVPSGPCKTSRVNDPDWRDVGDPELPVAVQPVAGMSDHTPPCAANHCTAAMGEVFPPLASERLNAR